MPQEDCLAAANEMTQHLSTITDRDSLFVNDWAGLPCGCFVWANQLLDYDTNCANKAPHPSALLVCLEDNTPPADPNDYELLPGTQYAQCPAGREVPQSECLAAANAMTAGVPTIQNRDSLMVQDWANFTPCGCFVFNNQYLDFDTGCGNSVLTASAQLVCKKVCGRTQ